MKLSANARDHVRSQITDAFAKEYKEVHAASKKFYQDAENRYLAFEADLKKVLDKCLEEAKKVISKHKLTYRENDGKYDKGMHLELLMTESHYSKVDKEAFKETDTCTYRNDEAKRHEEAKDEVNRKIERAVSKALFEIEVHGKKSDLQQIIEEVIAEIRKEG